MAYARTSKATRRIDIEDDEDPYTGPDPGYDENRVGSRLNAAEMSACLLTRRGDMDGDVEMKPLAAQLRAATAGKTLVPTRTRTYGDGLQGLCSSINHAGNTIAVGCANGKLLVLDSHTMLTMDTLDLNALAPAPADTKAAVRGASGVPDPTLSCTAVRYMPSSTGSSQAVVVAALGSRVLHVHVSTGKVLRTTDEGLNKVSNLVIRSDGQAVATCGSDKAVRIYDEKTGQLSVTLDHGDDVTTTGHSNDVFGLAWNQDDHNMLVSGGWDHTLQIWDTRVWRSVRSIYGPYVCGDSLDIRGGVVLAGSWRHSHPLELWDLGSTRLLTRLPFHQPLQDACMPYCAKFGRGLLDGCIVAGGSGKRPCVKLFSPAGELVGTLPVSSSAHSIDSVGLQDDRFLSICCADSLHVLDMGSKDVKTK